MGVFDFIVSAVKDIMTETPEEAAAKAAAEKAAADAEAAKQASEQQARTSTEAEARAAIERARAEMQNTASSSAVRTDNADGTPDTGAKPSKVLDDVISRIKTDSLADATPDSRPSIADRQNMIYDVQVFAALTMPQDYDPFNLGNISPTDTPTVGGGGPSKDNNKKKKGGRGSNNA